MEGTCNTGLKYPELAANFAYLGSPVLDFGLFTHHYQSVFLTSDTDSSLRLCSLLADFRLLSDMKKEEGFGSFSLPVSKFPLRLIDVQATLCSGRGICFTAGKDWDFHSISHTWSKTIRDLSANIGNRLLQREQRSSYEELFKTADFSQEESYKEFMNYLAMLATDGVEFVWFDALCINQMDNEEKSREIQNMAGFYSKSLACHILAHGIGRGYRLLRCKLCKAEDLTYSSDKVCSHSTSLRCLPRWFKRVWTLQEYLLPCETFFIVELEKRHKLAVKQLLFLVEKSVRTRLEVMAEFCAQSCASKSAQSICRTSKECSVEAAGRDMVAQEEVEEFVCRDDICKCCVDIAIDLVCKIDLDAPQPEDDELVLGSQPCKLCGRRRMSIRHVESHPNMYFVDELGYMLLLRVEEFISSKRTGAEMDQKALHKLQEPLWIRLTSTTLCSVLKETSCRKCSVEEDRVLGILGILGVKDLEASQLRSGKTLQEQLIHLARGLVSCNQKQLLLWLCIRDKWGGTYEGMSWAPCLKQHEGRSQDGEEQQEELFQSRWMQQYDEFVSIAHGDPDAEADRWEVAAEQAEVVKVSEDGRLTLTTKVVRGRVVRQADTLYPSPCREYIPAEFYCPFCKDTEKLLNKVVREGFVLVLSPSSNNYDEKEEEYEAAAAQEEDGETKQHPVQGKQLHAHLVGTPDFCVLSLLNFHILKRDSNYLHMALTAPGLHTLQVLNSIQAFDVWFVLVEQKSSYSHMMVCVGKSKDHLHKIGVYRDQDNSVFKGFHDLTTCTIGGFGCDLSEHLFSSSGFGCDLSEHLFSSSSL